MQTLAAVLLCHFILAANELDSSVRDWPLYRGGQQQLGVCNASLPGELEMAWRFKTGGPIVSSAVVSGETAFIGSGDRWIYALDIHSGEKRWSYQTGASVEASPLILNQSLYVGSTDGFFYSIDKNKGSLNWKFETTDKIVGSANWAKIPGEENPLILIGSYDGSLYALDSISGKERWRYESQSYINGSPAVYDQCAIVGGCDSCIHCISLSDGKPNSVFDVGANIGASIAFDGQRAYIGHYGNRFVCFDVHKQEIAWEYKDREFPFFSSAAISGNFVVFGSRDRRVHCINRDTGKSVWTFATKGQVDSSPIICNGNLFVGSDDGRLYRLGLSDGKLIWSYEIGSAIACSPAIACQRIIVGAEDGVVYAFGKKNQK